MSSLYINEHTIKIATYKERDIYLNLEFKSLVRFFALNDHETPIAYCSTFEEILTAIDDYTNLLCKENAYKVIDYTDYLKPIYTIMYLKGKYRYFEHPRTNSNEYNVVLEKPETLDLVKQLKKVSNDLEKLQKQRESILNKLKPFKYQSFLLRN